MAANKQQGQWFGLFLAGLTATCAGIYGFSGGIGKAALVIGLVVLAVSFLRFLKLKPLEGKPALGAQPAIMKLVGVLVVVAGWLLVLFGLHIASGVGGRLVFALVGLAISLVGIIYILPAACNKNAIWKA
jgi:heme/copper-type cytochrome/quinol oxidase subunit 4